MISPIVKSFACIVPTRNNRPELLENCLRMLKRQTMVPDHIEVVNDTPLNNDIDITWRYRTGYDRLRKKGYEVIFFIEDDDYYAPDYFETMLTEWHLHGRPVLFGTDYTIYYHLNLKKWFTFMHITRSSAMSTMLRPDMNFSWPADNEPFTDIHLWHYIKGGITFKPKKHICLGIKGNNGITGGKFHTTKLQRYIYTDEQLEFLKANTDAESFEFYKNYVK